MNFGQVFMITGAKFYSVDADTIKAEPLSEVV